MYMYMYMHMQMYMYMCMCICICICICISYVYVYVYVYVHINMYIIIYVNIIERESSIHCTLFSHISVPPLYPGQSHDFIVLQDHQILGLRNGNLKTCSRFQRGGQVQVTGIILGGSSHLLSRLYHVISLVHPVGNWGELTYLRFVG